MMALGGPKTNPAIDESEARELLSEDDYSFMPLTANWTAPENPAIEAQRMALESKERDNEARLKQQQQNAPPKK